MFLNVASSRRRKTWLLRSRFAWNSFYIVFFWKTGMLDGCQIATFRNVCVKQHVNVISLSTKARLLKRIRIIFMCAFRLRSILHKKHNKEEGRKRSTKCSKQRGFASIDLEAPPEVCKCIKKRQICTCGSSCGSGLSKSKFLIMSHVKCTFLTFRKDRCSQWQFCTLFEPFRDAFPARRGRAFENEEYMGTPTLWFAKTLNFYANLLWSEVKLRLDLPKPRMY